MLSLVLICIGQQCTRGHRALAKRGFCQHKQREEMPWILFLFSEIQSADLESWCFWYFSYSPLPALALEKSKGGREKWRSPQHLKWEPLLQSPGGLSKIETEPTQEKVRAFSCKREFLSMNLRRKMILTLPGKGGNNVRDARTSETAVHYDSTNTGSCEDSSIKEEDTKLRPAENL